MQDLKLELKLFHWHKDTRTLTAELSDLPIHGRLPRYITVTNPDTEQSCVFRQENVESNEEGELVAWKYVNLSHSIKMTIWND